MRRRSVSRTASAPGLAVRAALRRYGDGTASGAGGSHDRLGPAGPELEPQLGTTITAPAAAQSPKNVRDQHRPAEAISDRVGVKLHVPLARETLGDQGDAAVLAARACP